MQTTPHAYPVERRLEYQGGFNAFRSAEQAAGIELCGVVHSDERQLSLY